MCLMALHKYGVRVKQDARFCAQMECLGSAAVTVDLLEALHIGQCRQNGHFGFHILAHLLSDTYILECKGTRLAFINDIRTGQVVASTVKTTKKSCKHWHLTE